MAKAGLKLVLILLPQSPDVIRSLEYLRIWIVLFLLSLFFKKTGSGGTAVVDLEFTM